MGRFGPYTLHPTPYCLPQLGNQPRLAHTGLADEREHLAPSPQEFRQRRLQFGKLLLPPDELRPQALDAAHLFRSRKRSLYRIRDHGLRDPSDVQGERIGLVQVLQYEHNWLLAGQGV